MPQPCPQLVEIVEQGHLDDHGLVLRTLHDYFDRYQGDRIDSLVLGCTHFVFYRDALREILPPHTAIIDGNEGTVKHLADILSQRDGLAPRSAIGEVELLNSDPSERIAALSRALFTSDGTKNRVV